MAVSPTGGSAQAQANHTPKSSSGDSSGQGQPSGHGSSDQSNPAGPHGGTGSTGSTGSTGTTSAGVRDASYSTTSGSVDTLAGGQQQASHTVSGLNHLANSFSGGADAAGAGRPTTNAISHVGTGASTTGMAGAGAPASSPAQPGGTPPTPNIPSGPVDLRFTAEPQAGNGGPAYSLVPIPPRWTRRESRSPSRSQTSR